MSMKMYIVGSDTTDVHQYTLTVDWDLASAFFDSVSFNVSAQNSDPSGVAFSSDGTKMYIVGLSPDAVHQYTLSTAWDVSTASFDSVSFSVEAQDSFPTGIKFSTDGTKMYMVTPASDGVYQYTLSTAWALSTASFDSVFFSVAGEDVVPMNIAFSADGTKMYMIGRETDTVYQYTLSTAWDLTTVSSSMISFNVTEEDSVPSGMAFSTDGTKMYMAGAVTEAIYQYTLAIAWDLSSASFDSVGFNVSGQETSPSGIAFGADGSSGNQFFWTDFEASREVLL